jgi:Spy/CpxP family protein refolding chaperone
MHLYAPVKPPSPVPATIRFMGSTTPPTSGIHDMNPIDFSKFNPARMQRGVRRVALATVVAVASATALSAWAQPMFGGMGGHGHHGGPGMMMGSPEQAGRMVDHLLDGLNATDAQRTQIKQIAQAAAVDLKALHESGRAFHDKQMQIFTAPTVDANAAEQVRLQMNAQHDQVSKRIQQAFLDATQVLTPEQRAKIGERMKERQAKMQERMQHDKPPR